MKWRISLLEIADMNRDKKLRDISSNDLKASKDTNGFRVLGEKIGFYQYNTDYGGP